MCIIFTQYKVAGRRKQNMICQMQNAKCQILSNNVTATQLARVQQSTYNCRSHKNAWKSKSLSSHFLTRLIILGLIVTTSEQVGKTRISGKQIA